MIGVDETNFQIFEIVFTSNSAINVKLPKIQTPEVGKLGQILGIILGHYQKLVCHWQKLFLHHQLKLYISTISAGDAGI